MRAVTRFNQRLISIGLLYPATNSPPIIERRRLEYLDRSLNYNALRHTISNFKFPTLRYFLAVVSQTKDHFRKTVTEKLR